MTRARTISIVRIVVAVTVVVAVVWGVARNWTEISQDLQRVSIGALLLSFVPAALGTWLTMVGWRVILADLGSPLHLAPAGGVFFVGQLGKYLPGSVWTVLVQADMALSPPRPAPTDRRHRPRDDRALRAYRTPGGTAALPLLLQRSAAVVRLGARRGPAVRLPVWPRYSTGSSPRPAGPTSQPLEETLSTRAILTTVGHFLRWRGCCSACTSSSSRSLWGRVRARPSPRSLTGFALAGVAGMLTVILPAGLGARDGILAHRPRVGHAALGRDRRRARLAVRRDRRRRARGCRRLGVCATAPPGHLARGARAPGRRDGARGAVRPRGLRQARGSGVRRPAARGSRSSGTASRSS